MASVKIKLRISAVSGKEGYLYYQVIHKRVIRQINTGYRLLASEWDDCSGTVVSGIYDGVSERTRVVQSIQECIRKDKVRLNQIILSLENRDTGYTADDVVTIFHDRYKSLSFSLFMQEVIGQLTQLEKVRTSGTYTAAFKSFMLFRGGKDIMLDEIDQELIMLYESWLKRRGLSMNTISFYMRILQATYNRAVEKGLTQQQYPFRQVYTGVEKTVKRAVPFQFIRGIKNLELVPGSSLDFARDMFLFSFYTRGMSFVDMAYLRRKDLREGILTYRRRKTGQLLSIKWEKCMQRIVDKYPVMNPVYLLPIIREENNERKQYENALHLVNRKLKLISRMLPFSARLTMYVARHSWASAAKSKNIPVSVISEGMGHDSESTTQIYLASLDHSVIDKANRLILDDL